MTINIPADIDRLDYEIGFYTKAINQKIEQVLNHPDDWDVGYCERCGVPTVTIASGEPTWCRWCASDARQLPVSPK